MGNTGVAALQGEGLPMKRLAMLLIAALVLMAPDTFAKDHGEIGAFGEYFLLHPAGNVNFWGLGGRASFNLGKHVAVEGEMGYDFARDFNNGFFNGVTTTFGRSNLSLLHGLFGPKLQTGAGALRAFATVKGGFLNFRAGACAVTVGCFLNQVALVPQANGTDGAMFLGGGLEGFRGPVGLRLDVGDEIYWDDRGTNNNLKVTFGPHIRF